MFKFSINNRFQAIQILIFSSNNVLEFITFLDLYFLLCQVDLYEKENMKVITENKHYLCKHLGTYLINNIHI